MKSEAKTYKIGPLIGGMNTNTEDGGLYSVYDSRFPAGVKLRKIENWEPNNRHGLSTVQGFTEYDDLGASAITGIHRFKKTGGTTQLLATAGTTLYLYSGSSFSATSLTTLSSGAAIDFTNALNSCVICDGANEPEIWDGSSSTTMTTSQLTAARQSVFYQNRLWVFDTDSSELHFSAPDTLATNIDTNFVNCSKNDGQSITCIASFFVPGQLEPILLVGKEHSVGIIQGDGSSGNPYTFVKINSENGIPGFRQMAQFGNDMAFFTRQGVSSLQTQVANNNLLHKYLSEDIRDQFLNLNNLYLDDAILWYDWKKSRIGVAVAEAGKTTPNVIYYMDVELSTTANQVWYRERYATGQDITAVFIDDDGSMFHGDSAGKIHLHDQNGSFNGSAIVAELETDYMNFRNPIVSKRFLQAKAALRGNGNYSLQLQPVFDYGAYNGSEVDIPIEIAPFVWGGGVWTSDPNVYQWGAAPIPVEKFYPAGWFENVKWKFKKTGISEPIDLYDIHVVIQTGDLR